MEVGGRGHEPWAARGKDLNTSGWGVVSVWGEEAVYVCAHVCVHMLAYICECPCPHPDMAKILALHFVGHATMPDGEL